MFGYPYYHLHRADFHAVLESAVRAAQPDAVRLDARVEENEKDGEGVRAVLASGDILKGDVLIGCDGIHSRIRQSLFGPDTPTLPAASLGGRRSLSSGCRKAMCGLWRPTGLAAVDISCTIICGGVRW